MKFAIISDTHFGDDNCTLVNAENDKVVEGPKYEEFKKAAGIGNKYLILAGDILDFSIASYEKAYRYAQFFFQKVKDDNIADEIIYLAGNHDADIWHIIQHQRNVIKRLEDEKLPKAYKHSVPGIIDDRKDSPDRNLILYGVTPRQEPGKPRYGGMFLDKITKPDTFFNIAYPNLYIVTDSDSVLVTHGQYLERYWALLGEILPKIAYDDLKIGSVDIEEMIEMNFPLNQLACTGIGQADVLTKVVRQVEHNVKDGDFHRARKYLDRLEKEIDEITDYGWLKELIVDYIIKKIKEEFLTSVEKVRETRYSEEFIYEKDVRERFGRFYNASLLEIGDINSKPEHNIPAPWRVIFGHTHQPIPWGASKPPKFYAVSSAAPKPLTLHNTGGWLSEKSRFCGAEVFTYETDKGFSSVSVR